jgi:hypothetical protein
MILAFGKCQCSRCAIICALIPGHAQLSLAVSLTTPSLDGVLLDTTIMLYSLICDAIVQFLWLILLAGSCVDYLWPIRYLVLALLLNDALACPSMLWQALVFM